MRMRRGEPLVDTMPEHYPYRDDGCEVAASCLQCPLPQCKYDDPGWLQREHRSSRDREVLRAQEARGLSVPQLARRFGVSQRTVFRILSRGRAGAQAAAPYKEEGYGWDLTAPAA